MAISETLAFQCTSKDGLLGVAEGIHEFIEWSI